MTLPFVEVYQEINTNQVVMVYAYSDFEEYMIHWHKPVEVLSNCVVLEYEFTKPLGMPHTPAHAALPPSVLVKIKCGQED